MVFVPPASSPALPDIPDSITLEEFINDARYGRFPLARSRHPYTCGITGLSRSAAEVVQRTGWLARSIAKRLGFRPNQGTAWEKVVCVYSVNTIDYVPLTHAIHRLSGIVTPASAAYSHQELAYQLRSSGSCALFTCASLLDNALEAADAAGIPRDRVFLLPVPQTAAAAAAAAAADSTFSTLDDLVQEGKTLPELESLKWVKGQGARQTAYLCYSSGTSGLPKAVMISHYNIIANIAQVVAVEAVARKQLHVQTQVNLGVLPFSHIYGLVVIAHVNQYRGDEVIVLPRFEPDVFLASIQRFKIEQLAVVPPMIIFIVSNKDEVSRYDLSSVRFVYSGAAPLGTEVTERLAVMFPKWHVGQGYGMTEASPVIVTTCETDTLAGSAGPLVPGSRAKIIDADGRQVTALETRGELLFQSPSVTLGYLNNEKASAETFVHDHDGRWLRTGDEVLVRKSAQGNEHFVITDRIKELIKVKGHQVAPAELEAHLLSHHFVSDCAVIPIPDPRAGQVPKAFVVKSAACRGRSDQDITVAITRHVQDHKAAYKWVKAIEFIDAVPKSPSGKILRRLLKEMERRRERRDGAQL